MEKFKTAFFEAVRPLSFALPTLVGVVFLVALVEVFFPPEKLAGFFASVGILEVPTAAVAGSVLAGNPLTSYILGGEFLAAGASVAAVTAFLLAWVTVGVVQLPAEIILLGKKFALVRNGLSFVLAIAAGFLVNFLLQIL